MAYETLKHIYENNKSVWLEKYNERFCAPFTEHFDIHIKQYDFPDSYQAFLCITPEILYLINAIHSLNNELNLYLCSLPRVAVEQLTQAYMIEEIHASNEIEGVRSSRKEIRNALELTTLFNKDKAVRFSSIVSKYNKLINQSEINFETCQDIRNFYDEFILSEVATENITNKPDGLIFRTDKVHVTNNTTQEILHIGTFPEANLISEMKQALKILHDEKYPLVIRIAIFHYLFGYIHPFYDGNGRTIRFITSYFLAIDFTPLVAFNLSLLIKRHRESYYKMFTETTSHLNCGDLGFFVTEFLHIIKKSIEDVVNYVTLQKSELEKWETKINSLGLKDKTTIDLYYLLLQATIFSAAGISMQEITYVLKKSTNTIKTRLNSIPSNLLLIDTTEKTHRYKLNLEQLI